MVVFLAWLAQEQVAKARRLCEFRGDCGLAEVEVFNMSGLVVTRGLYGVP